MVDDGPGARVSWHERYESLAAADRRRPLDVEDLEALAVAAYLTGNDEVSASAWERAHHTWIRLGDDERAALAAFWLGLALLFRGEMGPASGWFSRGRTLLGARVECAPYGYLLVPDAIAALGGGDATRAATLYAEASAIAARCDDPDLRALAALGHGEATLAGGDLAAGLARLDEAMVGATTGDTSPVITGIVYCAVVEACVAVHDLRRAREWTAVLTRWCDQQHGLVPFRGQCLVHRSQVLQSDGHWEDALSEASRARAHLAEPPHPALGMAHYQQAELHRLRGEFAAAERAYRLASEHGRQPAPGLALLRLAEGKLDAAVAAAHRLRAEATGALDRLTTLPAAVEILVAAGDLAAAEEVLEELERATRASPTPYGDAVVLHAISTVRDARGDAAGALATAREASEAWSALDLPYERARSQVVVASACRALGDHDAADLELAAARRVFERLGAAPDVRRLERGLTPAADALLTARERDVLRLVAAGHTNRAIGTDLGISEHTVARHVQNIFTKIGVGSRAAATAYAYEHGVV